MKKHISKIELPLLNYTLLELLVLQYLFQVKQQITRYKLMQQVKLLIGNESISTAKFYRILTKLESNSLVNHISDEPALYFITPKGLNTLGMSKSFLGQVGVQVTTFFSDHMKNIILFSRYKTGRVLFIDFPKLFDLVVLKVAQENCEQLAIISDDDTFQWISGSIAGIQQSKYENMVLKEPDNIFDLVILFYPGFIIDNAILHEIYRCLKPQMYLLALDSVNPKEIFDHFVVDILVNQFWPIDYDQKLSITQIEQNIKNAFKHDSVDSLNIKGLELRLYEKNI